MPALACTLLVPQTGRPDRIAFNDVKVVSGRTRDLGDIELKPLPDHP